MSDQLGLFAPPSKREEEAKARRKTQKFLDDQLPVTPEHKTIIERVYEVWKVEFEYSKMKLTKARKLAVNARLHHGFTEEELVLVLKFVKGLPFWRGQNDRNKPYDDLATLFANNERTQRLLVQARAGRKEVDRRAVHLQASNKPVDFEDV